MDLRRTIRQRGAAVGRLTLWVLVAYLVAMAFPMQVGAQSPGITMQAAALYDGSSKYGEWLPVMVELENSGPDVRGQVRVRITGSGAEATYAQQVELPRGARKQVQVYTVPNNFSRRLVVEFVPEGEEEPLESAEVEVRPVPNIRFMAAAITAGGEGLESLEGVNFRGDEGQRDQALFLTLSLEALSDRPEALRTLDLIIISGVDTASLTPRQQAALEQYVAYGGMLALGGGPDAARVLAGIPESLVPVTLTGEDALGSLESLGQLTGEPIRVDGPFPAAVGEPVSGASTRLLQGEMPLAVERAVGEGVVYWLALDPALTPFDGWAGSDEFWLALVGPRAVYPVNLPTDVSPRQMTNEQLFYALQNLPSLDLPSLRLLVPLLAAYIFIVGPVNYLLLRRQRRMERAWVTIPVITLLFSFGAYGLGFQLRGSDVILNQVSIVQGVPGTDGGNVRSMIGIFSPSRRSYTLSVDGEALLSPTRIQGDPFANPGSTAGGGSAVLVQGQPALVEDFVVNQWSMRSVMAESLASEGFGFGAQMETSGDTLQGEISNTSQYTWKDVVVVLGNQFERLGDIPAGESREVSLRTSEMMNQPASDIPWRIFESEFGATGPSRDVQVRQQILSSLYNSPFGVESGSSLASSRLPVLLAWLDETPTDVSIVGSARVSTVGTTLLYAELPIRFGQGEVSVPLGMMNARLASSNGSFCYGPSVISLSPDATEAEVHFELPSELRGIDPSLITIHVTTDGGQFALPTLSLFNYETEQWSEMTDPVYGRNRVEEPDAFLSPEGLIQLRVERPNRNQGGCLFFDATLQGVLDAAPQASLP